MSELPTAPQPYTVQYGSIILNVDPTVVSKFSGKFKTLWKENPEGLVIEDLKYDPRVFLTFMSAAQGLGYACQPYLRQGVLELAEEWEAPKIVEKARESIENEQQLDPIQAVTDLIDAVQNKDDDNDPLDEIEAVGHILAECLEDDRMLDLPMYIIYRCIDAAEALGFDVKDLKPFAFKVFAKNPAQAVPLILRIDFDTLTDAEYSKIFCQPDIHEQNINFFASASMSSISKNANSNIKLIRESFRRSTANSATAVEYGQMNPGKDKRSTLKTEINEKRKYDLDRARSTLKEQQDTIDDLLSVLEWQQKALVQSVKRAHSAPSNEELLKTAQLNLTRTLEEGKMKAFAMIQDDADHEKDVLNDMLAEAKDRLDQCMNALPPLRAGTKEKIEDYRTQFDEIEAHLNKVQEELLDARGLMAAKIVKDKLRLDEYLRKSENRFKIFEAGPDCQMDVDPREVAEAEKRINDLEEKLEEVCPIRGKKHRHSHTHRQEIPEAVEPEPEEKSVSQSASKVAEQSEKQEEYEYEFEEEDEEEEEA